MERGDGGTYGKTVIVPRKPGPLLASGDEGRRHAPDDLDELIDELFPDVDDRPGWFDATLVLLGAGLLAWAFLGNAPTIVTVAGILALALGCILPVRSAWRGGRNRHQQRRREALLSKGILLDVSSPDGHSLVRAYEDLSALVGPAQAGPALAAAHGALLEVASLLGGRAPASAREREYVENRTRAVEALTAALRELPAVGPSTGEEMPTLDPDTLVDARDELDQITGVSSVSRLRELTEEARIRRLGHN